MPGQLPKHQTQHPAPARGHTKHSLCIFHRGKNKQAAFSLVQEFPEQRDDEGQNEEQGELYN